MSNTRGPNLTAKGKRVKLSTTQKQPSTTKIFCCLHHCIFENAIISYNCFIHITLHMSVEWLCSAKSTIELQYSSTNTYCRDKLTVIYKQNRNNTPSARKTKVEILIPGHHQLDCTKRNNATTILQLCTKATMINYRWSKQWNLRNWMRHILCGIDAE